MTLAIYVMCNGNPAKVSQGFDPDRNIIIAIQDFSCGFDLGYEDYPYIYFATP